MNQQALHIAKDSMRDNHRLLTTLGSERPVRLAQHPEENVIMSLLDLLPKSTAGKIALGVVALIAWDIFQSRD